MKKHLGRKSLLAGGLMLAFAGTAAAQLDTLWTATYGGASHDGARSLLATADGGFLTVGYTYSAGAGDVDVQLVKTDAAGAPQWQRTYGGAGRDFGLDVCESGDGGWVLAGFTTSWGAGDKDVYLVKVDAAGDTVWTRTYGGAAGDAANGICRTSTGHFVVAGRTESFGAGLADLYLLKVDAAGDTVWTGTFGGAEPDWGGDVCEVTDGGYVVVGSSGSNSSNSDGWLLKTDAAGAFVWETFHGQDGNADWGIGLHPTADNGVAFVGYRDIHLRDPGECYIVRADPSGEKLWGIRFNETFYQYGRSVCPTADGGFLVCGATKDPATQTNDVELILVSSGGERVWTQTIGGAGSDWGDAVVALGPGEYAVAGFTESFGAGGFDAWLLRLRDPAVGAPVAEAAGTILLSPPRPNPSRGSFAFTVQSPVTGELDVSVVNARGERVRTLHAGQTTAGRHEFTWDARNGHDRRVAAGVYFLVAEGTVQGVRRAVVIR